jgi:hypothetical protein
MQPGGMHHPREIGVADMEEFLCILANDKVTGLLQQMEAVTALQMRGTASALDSRLHV